MKKRIATIIALGLMAAAPAHAGSSFSLSLFAPGPVYYEPAPVYYAPRPVAYYAPPPVRYRPAPVYYSSYYSYAPPVYYGGHRSHRREHHREHRNERGHRDWR
jgi:hypothetical protein